MKGGIFLTFLFLVSGCFCYAQLTEILVEGKVTDTRTNKGINAFIRYSSIPTGSITGKFNDSIFSFTIFGTARYQVTAQASGYNPRTIIIDPEEIGDDTHILKNIGLTPKDQTIRLDHLIFAQGKSDIDPASFQELDEIAQMLNENKRMIIRLEGHTDNVGSPAANLKLSQNRVEAVKKYLVKQGVSKSRVKTKAFGGTQPLKNEMTPEDRALNRRVEMRILQQ